MLSTCQAFTQCRGVRRKEVISLRAWKRMAGGGMESVFPSVTMSGIELVDDEGNLI